MKSVYCLSTVGHVWKVYTSLSCAFFTRRAQGFASFLLQPKSKRYFVRRHSIPRESCVVSVGQTPLGLYWLGDTSVLFQTCACICLLAQRTCLRVCLHKCAAGCVCMHTFTQLWICATVFMGACVCTCVTVSECIHVQLCVHVCLCALLICVLH